jgi:4'-phosphopantetheinyl transferase
MISPTTVGLFRAPLDVDGPLLARLQATLSPEEHARAAALRDDRARRRFIADHGWRRRLLGERIGCAPGEVDYVEGEHGKPRPSGHRRLHFSATRSEEIALYALCSEAEVGVDAERIDRDGVLESLATRLLSPSERATYEALDVSRRPDGLYACWTRKEAYVKALGTGLTFPLTAFELWAGDSGTVRAGEIVVQGVELGSEIAAAVAVRVGAGEAPVIGPVVDLRTP